MTIKISHSLSKNIISLDSSKRTLSPLPFLFANVPISIIPPPPTQIYNENNFIIITYIFIIFIIYHVSKRKKCKRNTVKHGAKGKMKITPISSEK